MDEENVIIFKDYKTVPDVVHEYSPTLKFEHIPLIIDNGSYQCRVGWSISEEPHLIFKNLIARPRKDRCKKDAEPPVTPPIQIGNDIINIEAVRFQLKTQFDKNVVTHFEVQEQVCDYIFSHLGIDSEGAVNHPIVMTEAFVTPNYSRQLMSELLFEGYGIPAVSYGVDSLFSFYKNDIGDTALLVNCGYHTIHIIPVIKGKVIAEHARRINLGGSEMIFYLHKLLQLKYPVHVNAITMSRAEEILQEHCSVALDYKEEITKWANADYYDANVKKLQLPVIQSSSSSSTLTAEQQKERKKEMAKRLLEINARKREERLAEDEEQLNQLLALHEIMEDGDTDEFDEAIRDLDIKSFEDLQRQISNKQMRIEKNKQRIAAAANAEESVDARPPPGRFQPPTDPDAFQIWLNDTRTKYRELMARREARRARRAAMVRRRTAAAAERMRVISRLAAAGDDFGNHDSDWDAYKSISREADSDSEADGERLVELEEVLREYEPIPAKHRERQLHLAIEPFRVPELMFQPSMLGNLEAGLAETMEYLFKHFTPEEQLLLANNVFITGGSSQFPGLKERLERELLEMRPFKSTHKVVMAKNPSLDAWYGARDFASSNAFENFCITKEDYLEMGGEYLKEHYASNPYFKSPAPIVDTTLVPAGDSNVIKEEVIVDC
ncbi:actin-related protein 5 isoform X1 [Bombyx mandarina]|uniref:Actin-related protein 5 n=2 Tax=Bombyx TaxID=7090 RepID=A0A8R2M8J6_BOMMO|nr:actin-related protein 5 isoform X1 [Bombyx mandarina]XP_037876679.1 actin-related protein 5 isoform X1 [Bombyx mori]